MNSTAFHTALLTWFDATRRDLPWRRPPGDKTSPLDPYAVLVSEAMLQQTQVATVIPYFLRWLQAFPTLHALATADEQDVLKLWAGLGYYNRARNLHRAAKAIIADFNGTFPTTATDLQKLPGVGPYTAGAIASIAFDQPEPLVDGNVERVLSRIYGFTEDPRSPTGKQQLWQTARNLHTPPVSPPKKTRNSQLTTRNSPPPPARPGDFNSALMELGATVCLPRNPQCLICPVAQLCLARERGLQASIPPPRKAKPTPEILRNVYCLRRPDNTYLLEQRPPTGRWASLWQFITRDPEAAPPTPRPTFPLGTPIGTIHHALTHRRYTFHILLAEVPKTFTPPADHPTAWTPLSKLTDYPLSKPQSRIAEMLRQHDSK